MALLTSYMSYVLNHSRFLEGCDHTSNTAVSLSIPWQLITYIASNAVHTEVNKIWMMKIKQT